MGQSPEGRRAVIMWNRNNLVLLGVLAGCAFAQNQFQTQFQDFDYPQEPAPSRGRAPPRAESPRQSPSRGQAPDIRGQPTTPRTETTTNVAILKQINENNEDGSYTYGYEAVDGTFKLETRFVDGTVQGKYGYIDANGDVKIIEYGADAMGFQPEGDSPDGIVIPPPVVGNCTDCTYDYDYDISQEEETKLVDKGVEELSLPTKVEASNYLSQSPQLLFLAGFRHLLLDLLRLHSRLLPLHSSQRPFLLAPLLFVKSQLNPHKEISMPTDLEVHQEVPHQPEMHNLQEPENNHQ